MNIRQFSVLALILLACSAYACSDDDSNNSGNNGNNGNSGNNGSNNVSNNGTNNGTNNNSNNGMGTCVADGCADGLLCNEVTGECEDCSFDTECGADGVCNDNGRCECASGFHDCAGTCVSSSAVATCGDRCESCPAITDGTAVCEAETCGGECGTDKVLNSAGDACVDCTETTHCTDPTASVCDSDACVGCVDSTGCAHLTGTPVCNTTTATCVECVDDSTCGGKSCDKATGLCTTTDLESVGNCQACVADSECLSDFRCVPMDFGGVSRDTAFCLRYVSGTVCPSERTNVVQAKTSIEGVAGDYCGINEALTTCEAVLSYGSSCASAADCGDPGLGDAVCEPIEFDRVACSYACDDSSQCDFYGCMAGYCGGY